MLLRVVTVPLGFKIYIGRVISSEVRIFTMEGQNINK